MHTLVARLLGFAFAVYMTLAIGRALKTKQVPHRFYFFEKNKKYDYATRKDHPYEYWIVIIVWLILAIAGFVIGGWPT